MSFSPYSIDVVIPAFNAADYIVQTLQSVANQDTQIGNVIVINDGSTDNTETLVREFTLSKPDINLIIINQANMGLSAARNTGIQHSKANYIAFLDADDLWKSNKLSSQIKLFKESSNHKLGVVYCAYELIDHGGNHVLSTPDSIIPPALRGSVYTPLLKANLISGSGSSVLVKRSVFKDVGTFDESLKACEDWDMWLRIAKKYDFDYANKNLVSIRVHQNNMQKDLTRMLSAELMMLNKLIKLGEESPFLLWKFRAYLSHSKMKANELPEFEEYSPKLQALLTEWRIDMSSLLAKNTPSVILQYLELDANISSHQDKGIHVRETSVVQELGIENSKPQYENKRIESLIDAANGKPTRISLKQYLNLLSLIYKIQNLATKHFPYEEKDISKGILFLRIQLSKALIKSYLRRLSNLFQG